LINASPDAVFARISDPTNAPQDIPGVTAVEDVCGRWSNTWYRAVADVAGTPIELECEYLEYVFSRRLTVQCTGGLNGRVTWRLEPEDGRTRVNLVSEHRLAATLAMKTPESAVQEQMDRRWRLALANVKARVEAQRADPTSQPLAR
jgi:uncharacterized protein YndB with AHSA1/START domain